MKIRLNKKKSCHQTSEINDLPEIEMDIQAELNSLGKMAEQFAPRPVKSIHLPEKNRFTFSSFGPAIAGGLALLLVAVTYSVKSPPDVDETVNIATIYHEIETDEIFMNEITSLVEEVAYSEFYPEATTVENKYDFSDEFIEVIVPI